MPIRENTSGWKQTKKMKLSHYIYDLAGDDHTLLKDCGPEVQKSFLIIGLSVPSIFLLCFVSGFITFRHIFDQATLALLLSMLFAWMITNIYRLLLCTSSKNTLPHEYKPEAVFISTSIRVLFIWFMVMIISKPAETLLYGKKLDLDIADYKLRMRKQSCDSISLYYQDQIKEIKQLKLSRNYTRVFIAEKEQQQLQAIRYMNNLVESSGFYLQRIKFLCTKHPSCWLITLTLILLFTYPIYKKRKLHHSSYYDLKAIADRHYIAEDYAVFKKKYAAIFLEKHGKKVSYREAYEDAPYNTVKKEDKREFHSEKHLLSELYNA